MTFDELSKGEAMHLSHEPTELRERKYFFFRYHEPS